MACLSAVIIARDEERNIGECLEGLRFCDEIIVVDSGSRDRTREIARGKGAQVFERPFDNYASQKNFAVSKASGEWVLSIDADERVERALADEILQVLKRPAADGYTVLRQNRIFGRWMRHGGNAGDRPLRLAKREKAVFEGRIHEAIRLVSPAQLKNPLKHFSTPTVGAYMRKLNGYTDLEAQAMAERGADVTVCKARRRMIGVFGWRHMVQCGFLDGVEGFLFSVLSAYYEFVRYAKLSEMTATKGKAT